MGGNGNLTRRAVLGGVSTATCGVLAGCSSDPTGASGGTMSWDAAFDEGTSAEDRALLESTPVVTAAVTTGADVETALAVLGWNLSVRSAPSGLLGNLDEALSLVADVKPVLTGAIRRLERGLDLVEKMKETTVFGTPVWDLAVASTPSLEQFAALARKLKARFEEERRRLGNLEEATVAVVDHTRGIEATNVTRYGELPGHVAAAISIYEDVVADLDALREDVQRVIEITAEASASASDLPLLGQQVTSIFDAINDVAADVDARLHDLGATLDAIGDGLDATVDGASTEANDRFGPISRMATGSSDRMSVTTIRTDVAAYDEASVSGDGGPTATTGPRPDDTPTRTDAPPAEPAVTPGRYVTRRGRSSRGSFEFTVPTIVRAGRPFDIEGRVSEAYPEQYGGFKVYIDGREVASVGLQAGETDTVSFSTMFREPGTERLGIEVRFKNGDFGTDELVGRVTVDVRVLE